MIGVIFHWGLYSVPAYDDVKSAKRRKTQNGAEWYLKRLTEKGDYRPISGYKETQQYHKDNYGDMDYYEFDPINWNPDEWMKVALDIGASYVILTTKHHDGYCLWKYKNDLVDMFCKSARKHGLKVGLYYSWSEFNKSCTVKYLDNVVVPHIKYLTKYKPDMWWFDGHWELKTKYSHTTVKNLINEIKKSNPNVLINDRIPIENKEDINNLGDASYRVYEDRAIPSTKPDIEWEHINTVGLSWGYNKQQKEEDYKTAKQLKELYEKVSSLGGRFLINIGPDKDGVLDKTEVQRLRETFKQ